MYFIIPRGNWYSMIMIIFQKHSRNKRFIKIREQIYKGRSFHQKNQCKYNPPLVYLLTFKPKLILIHIVDKVNLLFFTQNLF